MTGSDLAGLRQRYAEEVCEKAGVRAPAVIRAFATVPREHHVGSGPWQILDSPPFLYRQTDDADPRHIYRDVLVAIEPSRLLNNGQPSLHAAWIDRLGLREGEHVAHVGSGTGYYTAILAELVGLRGRVTAIEIDPELAARARGLLAGYPQVEVVSADGGEYDTGPVNAIYVNGGATHPRHTWLDRLLPGGRLLLPLVRWPSDQSESGASGWGVTLHVERVQAATPAEGSTGTDHESSGDAAYLGAFVGIFPCIGAVDPEADRRLKEAFARGIPPERVRSLRRDSHPESPECWLHGEGYCLSMRDQRHDPN